MLRLQDNGRLSKLHTHFTVRYSCLVIAQEGACPSEELLGRFLERIALPNELATVSAHLESCASCRTLLALLADTGPTDGPEDDQPLADGAMLGPYRLSGRLGSGAMGDVFLAIDTRLSRQVAIKQVKQRLQSAQTQRLLLEEARGLARLNHPNIVSIFDVSVSEERVWLAMEYVDGVTLSEWLTNAHTVTEVVAVFQQVVLGLTAAHEKGVVHRDVKPANVLVGRDGRVRVSDFGLAMVDGVTSATGGTPAYMSPEQRAGLEVTAKSDQYSLGVSIAEALTGQRPTVGQRPKWPSDVPAKIRAVVERALQPDPQARFDSMVDFGAQFAMPVSKRRTVFAAVSVGCVLAVAMVGWFKTSSAAARPSLSSIVEQTSPSVVVVVASLPNDTLGYAAGVLVGRNGRGYVLTTSQVMKDAREVGVLRWNPKLHTYASSEGGANRLLFEEQRGLIGARLVRADLALNLAVLDLDGDFAADPLPTLAPATTAPATGLRVLAVGHPNDQLWSLSQGTLTGAHDTTLQFDVPNSQGLLGGALVDEHGQVLGVMTTATEAVTAQRALELVDGLSSEFVADRSTPEKALRTCLRAYELGEADAWFSCTDEVEHWRGHADDIDWMLRHASPVEAHFIRVMLDQLVGDYRSVEHARYEAATRYRQMFSHDPPAVKARGGLMVNWGGGALDFPSAEIKRLQLGVRVERVVVSSDSLVWLLIDSKNAAGGVDRETIPMVRCRAGWCIRQVPFPEEAALRPPDFPPTYSWEANVERNGTSNLEGWRMYLDRYRRSWWR